MPGRLEYIVPTWAASANVRALTTTRAGGVSQDPYRGLNLAQHLGDDPDRVFHNRARLAAALNLPSEPIWLRQEHGNGVHVAKPGGSGVPTADAVVIDRPGLVGAILTADCLPVLFAAADGRVVAAAHAGWRGLLRGVLVNTLAAIAADPRDIAAWLGPAISASAYEVGIDVHLAFTRLSGELERYFLSNDKPGHWLMDLSGIAAWLLARQGVRDISAASVCTYADSRFYSHRRDGLTGRQATLIWVE